jgi:hypothetical protein
MLWWGGGKAINSCVPIDGRGGTFMGKTLRLPTAQAASIVQRRDSLRSALNEHVATVLGKRGGYEYLPLCAHQKEPVSHYIVYIWNLPNSGVGYVFSLIRDDVARKIIARDDEAVKVVLSLLQMHKEGKASTQEAQRLRDYLFPPL